MEMKSFGFVVAHGYRIFKGYIDAKDTSKAAAMILEGRWDGIIDEDNSVIFTKGYELLDIWEIE